MTLNALNYQKCAVLHKILDNLPIEKLNSFLMSSAVTMFIEIHCIKCIFLQFNIFLTDTFCPIILLSFQSFFFYFNFRTEILFKFIKTKICFKNGQISLFFPLTKGTFSPENVTTFKSQTK